MTPRRPQRPPAVDPNDGDPFGDRGRLHVAAVKRALYERIHGVTPRTDPPEEAR